MRKLTFALMFVFVAAEMFAQVREPALVPRPLPPPTIRPVRLQGDEKPTTIARYAVEARVVGAFATVRTEIVVSNPNGRPLEGALEFPLPDGASVCGYALDVNGVMTDGVVVKKEKARVAFEEEVKKGVDPGLVEHVKGNAYRTRVYPIPANGSRNIRVDYVTPLAFAPNGDAALILAMPRVPLKERKVSITVPIGGGIPQPVLGGLGDRRFAQAEAVWRSETTDADVTPDADVTVALPAMPERVCAVERVNDEVWFAISDRPPSLETAKTSLPKTWRILWDASGSRSAEDVKASRAVIDLLPEEACYELVVFRNAVEAPRICATRRELMAALDRAPCDGGTDFAALAAFTKKNPSENRTLLFTDGMDVLGDGEVDFGANKPIAVMTGAAKDGAALRRICGGRVIDLALHTVAQALEEIGAPAPTLAGVTGEGIANVQGVGQLARGRVTVLGRLTGDSAEVRLDYGNGRRSKPATIRRADAREGKTLATAWAAARVHELSSRADDNADELLAIGRRYGLTSTATSMIVFERLDQWLTHDVEPPVSAKELHEKWMARRPSEAQRKQAEERRQQKYFAYLKNEWEARVKWWNDPIPSKPKPPKSGLFDGEPEVPVVSRRSVSARSALVNASVPREAEASFAANEERGVAADFASDYAMAAERSAPAPVRAKSANAVRPKSAVATVKLTAWDPKTPYLQAIKDAVTALGGGAGANAANVAEVAYGEYLVQRKKYAASPAFYLDCAGYFFGIKANALAVRVISNLAELRLDDPGMLRTCAWRLREAGELDAALPILRKVAKLRPEEPHSFRDLAIALEERGRRDANAADVAEAMANYHKTAFTAWKRENAIWTAMVSIEELNALVAWSGRQKWPEGNAPKVPEMEDVYRKLLDLDVRIALAWDTDNTDVDLHVLEPDGEEAYYQHKRTSTGGFLTHDVTTGYGPEEYLKKDSPKGVYKVLANYFGSRQQTLLGPATVTATVFTNWGRADEKRQILSLRLDKVKDKVSIGEVMVE